MIIVYEVSEKKSYKGETDLNNMWMDFFKWANFYGFVKKSWLTFIFQEI